MPLEDRHPDLVPDDESVTEAHDVLAGPYRDYVRNVSPAQMAISYETACYIWFLCRSRKPARVADFGSGFTSYVLRKYGEAEVVSVDDSAEWLFWSRRFCDRHDALGGVWLLYPEAPIERFDLIVYDFGSGEFRNEHFKTAVDLLAPGGVIVFDDAQHTMHHAHIRAACQARRLDLFTLERYTLDDVHRYAAIAVHTEASR